MDEICSEFNLDNEVIANVKAQMLSDDSFQKLSLFFKAICDETRIKILFSLSKETMCVCDIAELLGMTISAISHQLRILRQAQLVKTEKRGKSVYYSLCDEHVEIMLSNALNHIME